MRSDGVLFGDVSLFYGCSARLSGCPDCSARCIGMRDRPTPRLSRAAERVLFERHGIIKENMFANSGWRRRLQALLGRGMAGDGRSVRPTVGTAETPRSPTRAGT